jgi:hypothetical protein
MTNLSEKYSVDIASPRSLVKIIEILELMEKGDKSKDWILQQLKQKGERIPLRSTSTTIEILRICSPRFRSHIRHLLANGKFAYPGGPPPLTQTYHWFFTDIVDSSKPSITTNEQAYKILALNMLIDEAEVFKKRNLNDTIVLPTGDGVAIGFGDSSEKPLKLAIQLHKQIKKYNEQMKKEIDKLQVRIGLDTGPVYHVKDLNGHDNVWGPGIIMARRVMDLARGMNILASGRFAHDIGTLRIDYKKLLHAAGDYPIKHGQKILIYNIYDEEIGNKRPPPLPQQKSKADQEISRMGRRFLFLNTLLELRIMDPSPKVMLTHHILEWHLLNVLNEPVEMIFFTAEGDIPRSFADLNLIITDEDKAELEIMSLDVNKPQKKELFAKFKKPLKPGKTKKVRFEWDWEEPDRYYTYRFTSDCKRFIYKLSSPSDLEIHQRVVKIDINSGNKIRSSTPPDVSYSKGKTEVTWKASNLQMFDMYRFDW